MDCCSLNKNWTPVQPQIEPPRQQIEENGTDKVPPRPATKNGRKKRLKFTAFLLTTQAAFVLLFASFVQYGDEIVEDNSIHSKILVTLSPIQKANPTNLAEQLAEEGLYPIDKPANYQIPEEDLGSGEEPSEIPTTHPTTTAEDQSQSVTRQKMETQRIPQLLPSTSQNAAPSGRHPQMNEVFPLFQDVHVMMFMGFGFLMTFLKKYGYSAVGVNMLLAAVVLQWATLCQGFFHMHHGKIMVNIQSLLNADFASATVLISFGALLGKTSPLQLLVMAIIEIAVFAANEWVGIHIFGTSDVGASVLVHVFGAYFGLMVSLVLHRRDVHETTKEGATYQSDIFAMIGTIFLWLFWPSFNAALAPGHAQHRVVINTYYSLAACCVTTFAISAIVDKHSRFNMVHVQNSTLAGGVAIGTAADLMVEPFGAMLVGITAGILSVFGYRYITPFLAKRLKIHDTCGVHNLHGMPGVLAGIIGAIMAATASENQYGKGLYEQYPMRAPRANTTELHDIVSELDSVVAGEGWSAQKQAGYQILTLVVTLLVAMVGGLITGLLIRFSFFDPPNTDQLFDDEDFWEVPEEEPLMTPVPVPHSKQDESKNSTNGGKDELLNMAVF